MVNLNCQAFLNVGVTNYNKFWKPTKVVCWSTLIYNVKNEKRVPWLKMVFLEGEAEKPPKKKRKRKKKGEGSAQDGEGKQKRKRKKKGEEGYDGEKKKGDSHARKNIR